MQDVHTYRRRGDPFTRARTRWMFGFQRRLVRTCEWETERPHDGCFPQSSQTAATGEASHAYDRVGLTSIQGFEAAVPAVALTTIRPDAHLGAPRRRRPARHDGQLSRRRASPRPGHRSVERLP